MIFKAGLTGTPKVTKIWLWAIGLRAQMTRAEELRSDQASDSLYGYEQNEAGPFVLAVSQIFLAFCSQREARLFFEVHAEMNTKWRVVWAT